MPYVGLTSLHFVQWRKTTWRKDQCVNALCRAHVSARPVFAAENVVFEEGVNALCRALVSAPCPLKTPVFMRVSDPVFLCIYLNCQIFGYNKAKKWARVKLYF